MSKEIELNNTKKEFLIDLIKAQSAIETVYKDKLNPHFKNKYVPLCDILAAVKPSLNSNNFFLTQKVLLQENQEFLSTEIIHTNGESLSMLMPLVIVEKGNPQKYGSAMTYMRRYSLTALLALEEDDDDGEKAAAKPTYKEKLNNAAQGFGEDMKEIFIKQSKDDFDNIVKQIKEAGSVFEIEGISQKEKLRINKLFKNAPDLFNKLKIIKDETIVLLDPENEEMFEDIQANLIQAV